MSSRWRGRKRIWKFLVLWNLILLCHRFYAFSSWCNFRHRPGMNGTEMGHWWTRKFWCEFCWSLKESRDELPGWWCAEWSLKEDLDWIWFISERANREWVLGTLLNWVGFVSLAFEMETLKMHCLKMNLVCNNLMQDILLRIFLNT